MSIDKRIVRSVSAAASAVLVAAAVMMGQPTRPAATTQPAATTRPAADRPATAPAAAAPATRPKAAPATRPMLPLTPARLTPTTLPATPRLADLPRMTVKKPTTEIAAKNCITAECHPDVKNYRVVHGPVNVGACDSCHKLTSAANHTFAYTRDKTAICTFCHKMEDVAKAKLVHKPVANGDCLPCHNPHGANNKNFLRGRTMNDLCNSCHRDVIAGKKQVHGPVAAGACGACHKPHGSDKPRLLTAMGTDLCFGCHSDMKIQMAQAPVKHEAVEQDCSNCHDSHATNFPMQTRQAPLQLCTEACHKEVRQAAIEAPHRHSVVVKDDACLHCHTAHGGRLQRLMKAPPITICMNCHTDPIKTEAATVASVKEVLDPKMVKHGPVAEGGCGGCHNVHGSKFDSLLIKQYPGTFYASFDVKDYELCFTCHDRQLALTKATTTLTRFRNGDQNLHYLHVNKQKGRTCRACHSTHAGPNPMQVRESVPYGSWNMPVSFTPTTTGGTCEAGCHRELAYDRQKPVVREAVELPARPPAGPRPAGPGQPATRPAETDIERVNKAFQGKQP